MRTGITYFSRDDVRINPSFSESKNFNVVNISLVCSLSVDNRIRETADVNIQQNKGRGFKTGSVAQ